MGGLLGALMVGIFSRKVFNSAGADGAFAGDWSLLGKQALGLTVVGVFTVMMTMAIFSVLERTIGIRVTEAQEVQGLDTTQHAETAHAV